MAKGKKGFAGALAGAQHGMKKTKAINKKTRIKSGGSSIPRSGGVNAILGRGTKKK